MLVKLHNARTGSGTLVNLIHVVRVDHWSRENGKTFSRLTMTNSREYDVAETPDQILALQSERLEPKSRDTIPTTGGLF